ncbi:MAG: ParB/RepB/Spo0J family partition protein, partial [Clostridia bacterium]
MNNKKGLGRGLEELLSVFDEEEKNVPYRASETKKDGANGVAEVDIALIDANPNQPRKNFDKESLNELANSIKMHGVIQPIVLNKNGSRFLIIAGERRFRASKIAGLSTIPAVVKNYTEKQVKEISIIENLQREDLNPIEAARAIKQL